MNFFRKIFGFGKTVEPKITAPLNPASTAKILAVEPIAPNIEVDELIVADIEVDEPIAATPISSPAPTKITPVVVSDSVFKGFDQIIQYPTAFDLRRKRIKQKIKNNKKAPKGKFRKIPVL